MDYQEAESRVSALLENAWITVPELEAALVGLDQTEENTAVHYEWRRRGQGKIRDVECPTCRATGLARWRFLGQLMHPACGARWVEAPWSWAGQQGRRFESPVSRGVADALITLALVITAIALFLPLQLAVFALAELPGGRSPPWDRRSPCSPCCGTRRSRRPGPSVDSSRIAGTSIGRTV